MSKQVQIWLFIATVVLLPVSLFGIVKWYQQRFETLPLLGPEDHVVGSYSFTDQYGAPVNTGEWGNGIVVAGYFFTHCPVVCPKIVEQLKRVQQAGGEAVSLYLLSVDPVRDDTERLQHYARRLGIGGNWLLITGEKRDLYRFARKELFIVATDGDGGEDDFIHSENLILVDPLRRIRGYYRGTNPAEADRLVKDIKKLEKEFAPRQRSEG